MKIVVQKFGGTSVRDESARTQAIKHIQAAKDEGIKSSSLSRQWDDYPTLMRRMRY